MRRFAFALTLVASVACHRGEPKKPPPTVSTIAGESTVLPHGAADADVPVKLVPGRVDVAGMARGYLVVVPAGAPDAGPRPLVFVIHGDGGSAASFHDAWKFERASKDEAILVYLEGRNATWDLETLENNADFAYVDKVVEAVAAAYPIDRSRIFATGYSSGGFFANVLACHRPGLLRAIASNAGGAPFNQATTWPNGFPKCPGQTPTAVISLHGEDDSTVTLDSGRYDAEYWAYVNGCNEGAMETTGYPECQAYRGCPSGKGVAFCKVPHLNHWVWTESAAATWSFFRHQ